jgi:hypothetical protein
MSPPAMARRWMVVVSKIERRPFGPPGLSLT